MKNRMVYPVVFLLILCLGASFRPIGCKTDITGVVTDVDDNPIQGVTVSLEGEECTPAATDADGIYTLTAVPYGAHTLLASCTGYSDKTQEIDTSYISNGLACRAIDGDIRIESAVMWVALGVDSASGGGISDNAGDSEDPSVCLDEDGNPVIAWEDDSSGNSEIYVKKWTGSAWSEIGSGSASGGGISNNNGYSGNPSIAIGADDKPVVAWDDSSSTD